MLGSIAGVYASLDQSAEAIETGEQALAHNRELYGEQSEPVLAMQRLLARRYELAGDTDKAMTFYERQLASAQTVYTDGQAELGEAEIYAGYFYKRQGDTERGVDLLLSGIDRLRPYTSEFAESFIWAVTQVVHEGGETVVERDLDLLGEALIVAQDVYGEDSLYAATAHLAIGRASLYAGDKPGSDENYARALQIYDERLGRLHGDTIQARQDHAVQLNVTGMHAEAEVVFRELADRLTELHGEQHRNVGDIYQNLATTITYQRRFDESVPLHRKAYGIYKSVLPDHYLVAFPLLSIASIEVERGDGERALPVATEALERLQQTLPDTYAEGVAMCLVGLSLELQGDMQRGTQLVDESHELILSRGVLVPKYIKLCRVPGPT